MINWFKTGEYAVKSTLYTYVTISMNLFFTLCQMVFVGDDICCQT